MHFAFCFIFYICILKGSDVSPEHMIRGDSIVPDWDQIRRRGFHCLWMTCLHIKIHCRGSHDMLEAAGGVGQPSKTSDRFQKFSRVLDSQHWATRTARRSPQPFRGLPGRPGGAPFLKRGVSPAEVTVFSLEWSFSPGAFFFGRTE